MHNRTERVIKGHTHANYQHTVDKAAFYRQIVTGKMYGDLVYNYKARESDDQKAQRVIITQVRTKSVAGKIEGFFESVFRPDKIRFEAGYSDDPSKSELLSSHIDVYGPDGESLLKWSEDTALFYNDIDPNSFFWNKHSRIDDKNNFEPFIFTSEQVRDFHINKGSVQWCVCQLNESITFATKGNPNKTIKIDIFYYFAPEGMLELSILIDADLNKQTNYYDKWKDADGNFLGTEKKINGKQYLVIQQDTETKMPPVTRIGYKHDKETNKKTYVSFWDKATEIYKRLVNDGSALDISKMCHIFMQKFSYYTPCNYMDKGSKKRCQSGHMEPNGGKCPKCKGTGQIVHISGQDEIKIKLPTEEHPHIIKPSDLAFYLELPFNIVEFQQKLVMLSTPEVTEAIFGVNLDKQQTGNATATEINNQTDTAQDTLFAFTKAPKKIFEFAVKTTAEVLEISEGLNLSLEYTNEYSLESEGELLDKLIKSIEGNLPPNIIEHLTQRVEVKQNRANQAFVDVYAAMRKFMPFGGMNQELRNQIVLSLQFSDPQRALALNFKEITEDIVANNNDFLMIDYEAQKKIVDEKAAAFAKLSTETNSVSLINGMLDSDDPEAQTDNE